MIEATLVVGLATWRVASLLVHERGPYGIFARLRAAIQPFGEIRGFWLQLRDEVAQVLACVWCCSLWVVGPLWALYMLAPLAVAMLAAAAVAVAVEEARHHGPS